MVAEAVGVLGSSAVDSFVELVARSPKYELIPRLHLHCPTS